MRCGFAEIDITPPVGTWLHGFGARSRPSEGTRDPLCTQAAAFEASGVQAVVVSADILSFHPDSVARIRRRALSRLRVEPDHLLLAATHTHAGPAVADIRGMGRIDRRYLAQMEDRVLQAIERALGSLAEARISVGTRPVAGIGRQREGPEPGSSPADEDLAVLSAFSSATGRPLGFLWSYGCHPVTLGSQNQLASADYPGAVREAVRRTHRVPVLHLQSASGDVDPLRQGTSEEVDRIAGVLSAGILQLAASGTPVSGGGLRAALCCAPLPTLAVTREELAQIGRRARSDVAAWRRGMIDNPIAPRQARISLWWARDMRRLLDRGAYPAALGCPVQILGIGSATVIGVGAEVFGTVGREARSTVGRETTLFAGYANGCIGYVPSTEATDSAGYASRIAPQWYGRPLLAPGADRKLLECIAKLESALARGDC